MQTITKIALILLLSLTFSERAFAQEFVEFCERGIKTCEPLSHKTAKYNKCISIICIDDYNVKNAKDDPISECDIGYRKCNILRDEPLYYWTCVDETCRSRSSNADFNCKYGHQQCQGTLTQYWVCMSETCRSPYEHFKTCEVGRNECEYHVTNYWNCVTEQCLGDVYKYRDPNYYKNKRTNKSVARYMREIRIPDTPPEYTAPPLRGVAKKFKYAPQNINGYDWLSTVPSPIRTLKAQKLKDFSCGTNSSITCSTADISSCICDDGSAPKKTRTISGVLRAKREYYKQKYLREQEQAERKYQELYRKKRGWH